MALNRTNMGIFSKLKRQKPIDDNKEEAKKAAAEAKKEEKEGKKADRKKGQSAEEKPAVAKPEEKKEEKRADKSDKSKGKSAKKLPKGALAKDDGGQSARLLLEPVLTEKASHLEALGQYVFLVAPTANKVEVAEAVRDLYGVKPVAIKIVNVKGKRVRFGRTRGQRKDRKKAIVSLRQGDAISLTE